MEEIANDVDGNKLFSDDTSSEECCRVARRFLQRHTIWMHDVLEVYHRRERRECSASDSDIVPEQFTDFRSIFDRVHLNAVAFTSEQATKWSFDALAKQELVDVATFREKFDSWKRITLSSSTRESDIKKKYMQPFLKTLIGQREISLYILPAPVGRGPLTIAEKLMIYKNFVLQDLYGQVQENASKTPRSVGDVVGKFIKEQPYTATMIAFGVGWLLGRTHRPL